MYQQPFGQLPKVPTTKELWKNEPNKYRMWVIFFVVSLITIVAISITTISLLFVNKSANLNAIEKYIIDNDSSAKNVADTANSYFNSQLVIWPSILGGLSAVAAVLYIPSLFEAYKEKSFAKLHGLAGLTGIIVGLISLVNIIFVFRQTSLFFGTTAALLLSFLITPISLIFGFFGFKMNGIRKLFMVSERVEKLKNDPNFQKMQEQMQNMFTNMNNPGANNMQQNSPSAAPSKETPKATQPKDGIKKFGPDVKNIANSNESKTVSELKKLPIASLRAIAKELSVSGYSKMSKDELIKTIERIKD